MTDRNEEILSRILAQKPRVTLVTGASGVGKSSLVRQCLPLQAWVGRCDPLQVDNYQPILQALDGLVERSDQTLLRNVLDPVVDGALWNLLPSLGPNEESSSLVQPHRIAASMCALLDASPPLVLFLDDAEWMGEATISLLQYLLRGSSHFQCVLACSHVPERLAQALNELATGGIEIQRYHVEPMGLSEVSLLLSRLLCRPTDDVKDLALVVHRLTGGVVVHILELMRTLTEHGMLYHATASTWKWIDPTTIEASLRHWTMKQSVMDRIQELPQVAREALLCASFLGSEFQSELLEDSLDTDEDVIEQLVVLKDAGFLQTSDSRRWSFTHNLLRSITYELIPETDRGAMHLVIARRLWALYDMSHETSRLFSLLIHLRKGAHLLEDPTEKDRVVDLFVLAADIATNISYHALAAAYYQTALSIMGPLPWDVHYHRSLTIANGAAEAQYYNGDPSRTRKLLEEILTNAREDTDKMRAVDLYLRMEGSTKSLTDAVDEFKTILADREVILPDHNLMMHALLGYRRLAPQLKRLSNQDVLELPMLEDEEILVTLRIMALSHTYISVVNPPLAIILSIRMARLTLENGVGGAAAVAFATIGHVMCNVFGDIADGARYGRLALDIATRFDDKAWLSRVAYIVNGFVLVWVEPARNQIEPLLKAHRTSMRLGDSNACLAAAVVFVASTLASSYPLQSIENEMKGIVRATKFPQREVFLPYLQMYLQFISNMSGRSADPLLLTGDVSDEGSLLHVVETSGIHGFQEIFWLVKLQLAVFFEDYDSGLTYASRLEECSPTRLHPYSRVMQHYFSCLLYSQVPRHYSKAKPHVKKMRALSKQSGMIVPKSLMLLVEAVSESHRTPNLTKFHKSIEYARATKLHHRAAIANEFAAEAVMKHDGDVEKVRIFWEDAIQGYEQWGATAKVQCIQSKLAALPKEGSASVRTPTSPMSEDR